MFIQDTFSKRLRSLREIYNLSEGELSSLLNLKSRGSIYDFEGLRTFPSAKVLCNISDLFSVSTDWLCGQSNIAYQEDIISAAEEKFIREKDTLIFDYISHSPEYQNKYLRSTFFSLSLRINILFIFFWFKHIPNTFTSKKQNIILASKKEKYGDFLNKIFKLSENISPLFDTPILNKIKDNLNSHLSVIAPKRSGKCIGFVPDHSDSIKPIKASVIFFPFHLKKLRKSRNLSQKSLGEALDIGQRQISYYENGDDIPSLTKIIAIANYFKVSIDYLLGHEIIEKE